MKEDLNSINNPYLIKISDNWVFFFIEEDHFISSPVASTYFLSHDLSINAQLRLKWALFGWFFFKSLSEALDNEDYKNSATFPDAINPNFETSKCAKILLFDAVEVNSLNSFKNCLENEYTKPYFDPNALVNFKLKLNASELITIQNTLFPKIGEWE